MSLFQETTHLAASGLHGFEPRRSSMRDSYVPAAGLLLAAMASLGLWVGLVEAVRFAVAALF